MRQQIREIGATPEAIEHARQLEIQLAQVAEADRQIRRRPRRRPTLWDRAVIRAWRWATASRLGVDHSQSGG